MFAEASVSGFMCPCPMLTQVATEGRILAVEPGDSVVAHWAGTIEGQHTEVLLALSSSSIRTLFALLFFDLECWQ